jgi:predicted transposase YbfD/YdcC
LPKKTFTAALEAKGELVVQLKENQKNLLREVSEGCDYFKAESRTSSLEKSRNRIESRIVEVFDIHTCLIESHDWKPLISRAVRVKRHTELFDYKEEAWKKRSETAYYLCTHSYTAERAATIIREHWHSENRNHYVRDVSLGEDSSRIRTNAGIFARLRSFALNIFRFNKVKNVREALFENALDFNNLMAMEGIMT